MEKMLHDLLSVNGLRLAVASAGIKDHRKTDLVLIDAIPGTKCAAVFTKNLFCAAPVLVSRSHLKSCDHKPRAFIINSGNANAGTGEQGYLDAVRCAEVTASSLGYETEEVLTFSTGVIGEPLPMQLIESSFEQLVTQLTEDSWNKAAEAIMTTDTCAKGFSKEIFLGDHRAVITGIAKGAGMIRPNMATTLAFIGTDLSISHDVLQYFLEMAVEKSFHRITIDGDTSTNDACALLATGTSSVPVIDDKNSPEAQIFYSSLEQVCIDLAQSLVRDAEGATKFISIMIEGGASEQECLEIAFTIAHSPLVKTACFASDPNWGRVLAAIGRANVDSLDINKVSIQINSEVVVEEGARAASYREEIGVSAMNSDEIVIRVFLGSGSYSTTIWTSDLSYDYVKINAAYRT